MPERLFTAVLNMSLTAALVIGCVLPMRLLFRRLPRIFSYVLWAAVLFRLLCPVSVSSGVSVLNLTPIPAPAAPVGMVEYVDPAPPAPSQTPAPQPQEPEAPEFSWRQGAAWIWLAGVCAMAGHGAFRYLELKRKLRIWAHVETGVRAVDDICSPFVLGLLRPVIYLPSGMPGRQREHILLHERHHLRRGDHIVKCFSYGALCLHWFNPAVWLAFLLADRDMELSCDEAVLNELGPQIRADYAQSLLDLSTGQQRLTEPLAFGESETELRIRHVLGWKPTARRALPPIAAVCGVILATTMLNPNYVIPEEEPFIPHIEELTPGYYTICDWSMDETTSGLLRIWIRLDEDGTGELRINADRFVLSWEPDYFRMEYELTDLGYTEIESHYGDLLIHGVFREEGLSLFLGGYKLDFAYAGTDYPKALRKPPVPPGEYGYVNYFSWGGESGGNCVAQEDPDPEEALLKLKGDGSGTLTYRGVTRKFTWDADDLITDDGEIQALPWMELLYFNVGYRMLNARTEPGIQVKLEEEQTILYLRRIP